jgi:D-xylose transport system substrate-binding protein
MKRTASITLLAGIAATALPGCTRSNEPQVAFLLSTVHEERYQKDVRFFEARAHALGLGVLTRTADDDTAKQTAQVEEVLARGVKVLVIQPTDGNAAAAYVRMAHDKGAKVIAYDRAIIASDLDYYVSHDSYRVGVLQAEAALRATGGKGAFVLLAGQAGHSVATEITRGYKDTLAPYVARGEVKIVLEQNHSAWSPEQAMRSVTDALARTNNHVDAVLANNSGMARGAVQALSEAGLDRVFVAGADADAANVNLVCQGKQSVEVLKDIQALAKTAAAVAKQFVDGQRVEGGSGVMLAGTTIPAVAVRVDLVIPDNVRTLIVDSGFLAADKLPACKSRLAVLK